MQRYCERIDAYLDISACCGCAYYPGNKNNKIKCKGETRDDLNIKQEKPTYSELFQFLCDNRDTLTIVTMRKLLIKYPGMFRSEV